MSFDQLPDGLPIPEDCGGADHLTGMCLPAIALPTTDGESVRLDSAVNFRVIFIYPMTGRPERAMPDGWEQIPGARGCTPQACSFRDHYEELQALNADVFGLSVQSGEYQNEARMRLHLPFHLLSDRELELKEAIDLPTMAVAGLTLYKRLTLIAQGDEIVKVFYPVFPPDKNIDDVLAWLRDAQAG